MNSLEDCALDYLARGWSVIPIVWRGKRPVVRWAEYQHRCPPQAEVRRWFHGREDVNIGIVTGRCSGLVVVDVDPDHGGDTSLARIEASRGALPGTVSAVTGGGGRHIYFRHPGGIVRNAVAILPGIDVRGDGGYVVAPPSMHASGRRYAWESGCAPGEAALASMPSWFMILAASRSTGAGRPPAHWRRLVREGVRRGARNDTLASLAGHLLWHGVDPEVVRELLACWNASRCLPPLPDEEVARTLESIIRMHASDPHREHET